jgi:hypothetical protein
MSAIESLALALALVMAAAAATPLTGWTERHCAGAILPPILIALVQLAAANGFTAFAPSVLLRVGLELTCLIGLLHIALTADRRFPLIMAAAGLIALVARGVELTGLGGPHIDLLLMPALPLLIMSLALGGGIASGTMRNKRAIGERL